MMLLSREHTLQPSPSSFQYGPIKRASQNNLTLVRRRSDEEEIIHLHARIGSRRSQPHALALPQELDSAEPQLCASEVDAQANARSGSKGMVDGFGEWTEGFAVVEPAGMVKSVREDRSQ